MPFTQGHALLIGVGSYQYEPRLDVPVTAADAQEVANVLSDPRYCGYPTGQITVLRDDAATRDGILSALDGLAARASEGDTVLLFYSGHGQQGEDGSYYLTTYDTRLASSKVVAGAGVSQQELLTRLKALKARRVLLIFNACHSGTISPTLDTEEPVGGQSLPGQTTAALLATGEGRVVITACRENQYSFVGSGERTIFAQALVDGLRGQGTASQRGYISAFDLYTHLYFSVGQTVKEQVPESLLRRYQGGQEPELTVLKGVGPFAVALYQGSVTLGEFVAPERPAPGTAVREVTEEQSRAMFMQIIQQTTTYQGPVYQGPVTQVRGTQRNRAVNTGGGGYTINTGGGDYVEGDVRQQGVVIRGGTVHGSVIGTAGNVTIGGGQAAPADPASLADALKKTQEAAAAAEQRGELDQAEELQRIALDLKAALRAQESGDTAKRQEKLSRAYQDLEGLARQQPRLQELVQLLGAVKR